MSDPRTIADFTAKRPNGEEISLADKLGKVVPQLAPMLEQLTAMGYLKADQQKLNAELKLDKGVMTVNDLPL